MVSDALHNDDCVILILGSTRRAPVFGRPLRIFYPIRYRR